MWPALAPYGAGQDLLPAVSRADMHPLLGVVRQNEVLTLISREAALKSTVRSQFLEAATATAAEAAA